MDNNLLSPSWVKNRKHVVKWNKLSKCKSYKPLFSSLWGQKQNKSSMATFSKKISQINRLPQSMCNSLQVPQVSSFIHHDWNRKYGNVDSTDSVWVQCCKGPFLGFYVLHASLMYRHKSNFFVLFYCLSFYVFIFYRFPSLCHGIISLVSSHSLLQSSLHGFTIVKLREDFFSPVRFFTKESHI